MGFTGISPVRAAVSLALVVLVASTAASAGRAQEVRTESFKQLNQGVSAYNKGEFAEAVEHLERCTAMALNSFRAHYYLGLSLNATRRYAEAIEALTIALDLNPGDLQSLVALGDAHLRLGDIGESQAAYVRALKIRPAHAPALDGIARSREAQAKNEEAIEYFRRAILSNKGFAPAYTHLGDLYMRLDELDQAVRLLEEAVTIRPDYAMGLNRLAVGYGRLALYNEAVAAVRKAIELDPRDPHHLQTLGWLQLRQRAIHAAERSFRGALEIDERMPGAREGLADVARRRGDYDLALEQLDLALELDGLDGPTRTRLEDLRGVVEREQVRVGELETRIGSGEATPQEQGELATILASRGLWKRAAELQRNAPPSHAQREALAYMLFQDRQYREAHGIYTTLAAEAGDVALRVNDGVSLARLGDDPAAVEAFSAVLAEDPTNGPAHIYLGNAYLRMGRLQDASESYKAFLDLGIENESAERVRRILRQIAPEMLPAPDALLPDAPPPAPENAADEEDRS